MYSAAELCVLAHQYLRVYPDMPASTLGTRAAGNDKLFLRLFQGFDCTLRTALRASIWFDDNWPADAPWPLAGGPGETRWREEVALRKAA